MSAGNSRTWTGAGKINVTRFFAASTSTTSGVGAGEDQLPPGAGSSLLATNSFWVVAPLLMSVRHLGIPSVPPADVSGQGCVSLRACGCVEPKLQGMTSQCGGAGLMSYRTYRSVRYRDDVVSNLPKCPVPISRLCRTYRSVRYRY